MTRLLLIVLAVIAAATAIGLAIGADPGYVLISYGTAFRYQSSLWFTLTLIGSGILAIWLCYSLIRMLLSSITWANPWSSQRVRKRQHANAEKGLRELAEGKWQPALEHLSSAVKGKESLGYYLGAAQAAHEAGDHKKSEHMLDQALKHDPKSETAISLTRANLHMAQGEHERARNILLKLHQEKPRHPFILKSLYRNYLFLNDWRSLGEILPLLRKQKVLPETILNKIEQQVWLNLLSALIPEAPVQNNETAIKDLVQLWHQIPPSQQHTSELMTPYIQQLCRLGAVREAERVLAGAINHHYQPDLVQLYGRVHGKEPAKQLETAEKWLKNHPEDPVLLLTLGRLSIYGQLWTKARQYLEASYNLKPMPENCAELGRLHVQQGNSRHANELFLEGMSLSGQSFTDL